ncbi:hypothetical protein KIL84_011719 [Mauremys mutica]|uniref:Uncharacterized protein n=1 Tax=Mauremys mutica TaxID=74926 RepID=A0A9D4AVL7_9SAUR|nr:hypothetical protein KIL84_011719 [Mauremys mutica]
MVTKPMWCSRQTLLGELTDGPKKKCLGDPFVDQNSIVLGAVQEQSTKIGSSLWQKQSDATSTHMALDVALRNTPHAPAEHLYQIRKLPRQSKEDMFWKVLHFSSAEKRERKECREAKRQDRKENQEFVKDATEWKIKVMEDKRRC